MLYATPPIDPELERKLVELEELRVRLGREVGRPSPWIGTLRRLVKAASVESSISIEGFAVPRNDALAIVSGQEPVASEDEGRMAVASAILYPALLSSASLFWVKSSSSADFRIQRSA